MLKGCNFDPHRPYQLLLDALNSRGKFVVPR
jgi:hypothetical protein